MSLLCIRLCFNSLFQMLKLSSKLYIFLSQFLNFIFYLRRFD